MLENYYLQHLGICVEPILISQFLAMNHEQIVFISIFCVNNLSADTQLVMIIVVLFFTRYFLFYVSLTKYYYSIITKCD